MDNIQIIKKLNNLNKKTDTYLFLINGEYYYFGVNFVDCWVLPTEKKKWPCSNVKPGKIQWLTMDNIFRNWLRIYTTH